MRSALLHPDVVRAYLEKECTLNRMLGPFTLVRMPPLHINRFRFIPKCHNMGKWCLITDVSHPPGCSVNGGISSEVCSLSYTTVEQVAAGYTGGALLAKIDIEAAYRLILVHPHDCQLQAVEWEGKFYINPMVQFSHRLAPKIFNAVADTLEWCMRRRGIRHVFHYLDDFIVFGPLILSSALRRYLYMRSPGSPNHGPQAGRSYDLPHILGHRGGHSGLPTTSSPRQAPAPPDPPR